jgi:hypothetical protein
VKAREDVSFASDATDYAFLRAVSLGDYCFIEEIGGRTIMFRNIYHIIGHITVCARLTVHVISVSVSIIVLYCQGMNGT